MADERFKNSERYELLEKREIWLRPATLAGANLTRLAEEAARVLGLEKEKVLVTDVRSDTITFDILARTVEPEKIIGKKDELLRALSAIPGVKLYPETEVCSEGVLGLIALESQEGMEALAKSREMAESIRERISRRAIVFSTGFELRRGMIEDTNFNTIRDELKASGYSVRRGPVLDDEAGLIGAALDNAAASGYGLIITTGGVGAEEKDRTIEGLLKADPDALAPYIAKFQKGTGRHEKEGVRIGVGRLGGSIIVALPGPNDEVKIAARVLAECLRAGKAPGEVAEALASALRHNLKAKHKGG